MNTKIDRIFSLFCSRGVEFKRLDEIFNTKNGYTPSKANSDFWNGNTCIPWFRMEDIREHGNILIDSIQHITPEAIKGELFPADSIIVATSATIGVHALIKVRSLANQRFTYLVLKEQYKCYYDIKFLYYYCYKLDEWCLTHLNQSNFASVDMEKFYAFTFPLPPLEVQYEIVRILDNFTELTSELTSELISELTARKKQYEYYRNKMFFYDKRIPQIILDDVAVSITSGKNKERLDEGEFPVFGSTGIIAKTNTAVYNHDQILVARVGANAGYVHIAKGQYDVSDNTLIIDVKQGYLLKYIYYMLVNMNLNQYAKGGGQPLITAGELKKLSISMPKYEVQQKIVSILDNFETVCTDINIDLPAEIEARQKQYEYYRDKLLTFKELNE